jgi:capsular polysaccharide biosynthesis protein
MPMRLEDYWQLVRRRWRVVAIGAVVGAFLGALVPQLIPTKYQATMKLIVQAPYASRNPTEAYDANLLTTELASAYAGLLTDGSMAEQVIAERGPRLPAGELQSMIDAKAVAGTNLINVTVTDTSAERAKLVADSLEPAFQRRLAQLDSTSNRAYTPTVRLVEPATLPRTPVTPQAPRTALFGGILGALLAFGGVIVRQRTDKTIKDAEEVAALAELPTVRTVV